MNTILSFISSKESGVTTQEIEEAFPEMQLRDIVAELNILSKEGLVDIFKTRTGIFYRRNTESHSFSNSEEKIVFLLIKEAGREGIWVKDIKTQSGLHQNLVTKILRGLEQRMLVKAVKSIKQNRKVYMLYETTPSDELGDGPWFTQDAELDTGFVEAIKSVMVEWMCTSCSREKLARFEALPECKDLYNFIVTSGISSVALSQGDILRLLEVLVYEGKVLKLGLKYMPVFNQCRKGASV